MAENPLPLLLDADAQFSGSVRLTGPARIDGRVDGEVISSAQLWIGESGQIHARVDAAELIVEGALEGEIHASVRVELRPSARVMATLETPKLSVAEGAFFEGHCTTRA